MSKIDEHVPSYCLVVYKRKFSKITQHKLFMYYFLNLFSNFKYYWPFSLTPARTQDHLIFNFTFLLFIVENCKKVGFEFFFLNFNQIFQLAQTLPKYNVTQLFNLLKNKISDVVKYPIGDFFT